MEQKEDIAVPFLMKAAVSLFPVSPAGGFSHFCYNHDLSFWATPRPGYFGSKHNRKSYFRNLEYSQEQVCTRPALL